MFKKLWLSVLFLSIVSLGFAQGLRNNKDNAKVPIDGSVIVPYLNITTVTATNIYTEQITVSSIVVILSTTNALKTDTIDSNTSGNVTFLSPAFIQNVQIGTESVRTDLNNYSNVNSTTMVQVETNKQTINGYIVANSTNAEQVEILRSSVNTINHFVSVTSSQSSTINDSVNFIAVTSSNTGQIIILSNYQIVTSSNTQQIIDNSKWINLFSTNSVQINSNTNFINVTSSNTQQIIDDTNWISVNSSNSVELNFQKSTTTALNNFVLLTSSNSAQIINNTNWIVLNSSNIAKWEQVGTSSAAWYCDGTNQWNSNNGNVGIGTTAPTAKLDVNGLIVSTGIKLVPIPAVTSIDTLFVDADGFIGHVVSSRRYKENILQMENTEWIYKLKPVNYNYKTDKSKSKQYGLIAEDVEKVNKSLVVYKDGKPESVGYSTLIPILLNEIQELNKRIELLERKLK